MFSCGWSGSLERPAARAIGWLGAANALVGAAVHITEFSVDGYALPTLAHEWASAAVSQRPDLEYGARLALIIIGALLRALW